MFLSISNASRAILAFAADCQTAFLFPSVFRNSDQPTLSTLCDSRQFRTATTSVAMSQLFGWLDLSTDSRPAYSLICEQANGNKDMNLIKYDGVWMTKKRADLTDSVKRRTGVREDTSYQSLVETDVPDNAASDDNSKKFIIMGLGYDTRHEILSHICDTGTMPVFLRAYRGMPPTAIPLPPLARARDRKLRAEMILVAIKQATLEIHSGPANKKLQEWLSSIDLSITSNTSLLTGFDAVHSLSFPYFSRFPHYNPSITANNDIELMKKCASLRSVKLTFVQDELLKEDWDRGVVESKSVETLRSQYHLDGMLHLRNLKKLILVAMRCGSNGRAALQELGAWFKDEYGARNQILDVTVV